MKQVLITALLLFCISFAHGQDATTTTALNYGGLEKKLKKNDEAIVDEKDMVKPNTWFARGELMQDIHDVNIEFLRMGMMDSEVKLYLKDPKEIKSIEEDGLSKEIYVYERISITFQNNALTGWEETSVIHQDPLPEALKAYSKALELDEKGKLDKKAKENLDRLKIQAEADAVLAFTRNDYNEALAKFELIMEISKVSIYEGYIDSVIVYNASLAARNAGNHEKSAYYFERSAEISYGGSDTYYLLKNEYISLKDSTKALDALERGYAIYPDSTLIIFELVNYHLVSGNSEEGMRYLEAAEKLAQDNPSIFFAKGTLFEKLGEPEQALAAYQQALDADPEFFNAWFNIGALHFNNAVQMYDEANKLEDLTEYNKAKDLADAELHKAIPALLKAHEISPDDSSCLETLSTIYYRLQMTEERDAVKAKLDALEE
jgi:tetratricopeptide (TPR) repeat protein